jgi:hypothetical protein
VLQGTGSIKSGLAWHVLIALYYNQSSGRAMI